MQNPIADLQDFHRKFSHYPYHDWIGPVIPHIPAEHVKVLRKLLIIEEFYELLSALEKDDMEQIADGAADLIYVIIGSCVAYGIPLGKIWDEVHRSNMSKSMLKDEKSVRGKTIKGPDWTPPDIKGILFAAGWNEK